MEEQILIRGRSETIETNNEFYIKVLRAKLGAGGTDRFIDVKSFNSPEFGGIKTIDSDGLKHIKTVVPNTNYSCRGLQ